MKTWLRPVVLSLLPALAPADDDKASPKFKIVTKHEDDAVAVRASKDNTVFIIQSPSGKVTLDAAVSVQEGKARVRLWKDGKEDAPPDDKSPLWTEIRIVGGDGKPAKELPLKDGYFEVALPRAFFEGNPKSITVNWIDFYRN